MVGWLVDETLSVIKSFELRGQKQVACAAWSLSVIHPLAQSNFKAITLRESFRTVGDLEKIYNTITRSKALMPRLPD